MTKLKKPDIKTGIWIDQEKAMLVYIIGEADPITEILKSGVESRIRHAGETKVMARFGQAFINDQEKKQHRQKNMREKFFKEIIRHIQQADYIYVFGPSDARHELINDIAKEPVLKKKFLVTERSDRMSGQRIIKQTMDYFNGESFRAEKKKRRKHLASQ
jgi:stalled ribosome rescue protein Dom34